MPLSETNLGRRWPYYGSLALRILFSIAFIGSGIFKLSGHPAVVQEFNQVGYGQWLRYFTAALELSGAILLLIPRTIPVGALLMTIVCVGAFFAQLTALHGDTVHAVVMAAILLAIAWTYRRRFPSLLSGSAI